MIPNGQPAHRASETRATERQLAEAQEKLRLVRSAGGGTVELEVQRRVLEAEIRHVRQCFVQVEENVKKWRDQIVSSLQESCDAVARQLNDAIKAEEYAEELRTSCETDGLGASANLVASRESWLRQVHEQAMTFGNVTPAVDDIASRVQQLLYVIDRHMAGLMQHQHHQQHQQQQQSSAKLGEPVQSIDLDDQPVCVAICTNTIGYVGSNSTLAVLPANSAESADCTQLPTECAFVSFASDISGTNHLLVTSLDGAEKLRCCCELDWTRRIYGLHCDSARQMLYVAQSTSVTVTDLSGTRLGRFDADSLGRDIAELRGIDGNSDSAVVLDIGQREILTISKDSGVVTSVIDSTSVVGLNGACSLTLLQGCKILVVMWNSGQVCKLCPISKRLVASYPADGKRLRCPYAVAAGACGLMFVTERDGHAVQILAGDGAVVGMLGTTSLPPTEGPQLNCPFGAAVLEDVDHGTRMRGLVVADRGNSRLCVFHILSDTQL